MIKPFIRFTTITSLSILALLLGGCKDDNDTGWKPSFPEEKPEPPIVTESVKAPLYWSVYEYCYTTDGYIPEHEWSKNIDWVEKNLLPHGYDMICIDGWGEVITDPVTGYRISHHSSWTHDYAWWSKELKKRGMRLGIYDNPLWVNGDRDIIVEGTNVKLRDLVDNEGREGVDLWFHWVVADRPGAKEYINGFFKHYADMGVDYIRIDFLSWYEDGWDRNMGEVSQGYGRNNYKLALEYIHEAAKKYNIFISLVMPHLYYDAALEKQYGDMVRINEDTGDGGWWKFSDKDYGTLYEHWPQRATAFDGFIHWSHITGRDKVILDGDFIRLNTFANSYEKESCISLHLMAGGPVTVSDQYNTIGENLKYYQNDEMLALNKDGFVGKPLSSNYLDKRSQIWTGQMANGDWVIGFFNRQGEKETRSIKFSELGIKEKMKVRDLWRHADLGEKDAIEVSLEPHACLIVKLTK